MKLLKYNKIKFTKTFISKLIFLIEKIYNKRVEFNIVNLKKMHLNSDIYTQAVALKLRNRDNRLYRVLKSSL
jgi:ribosomal protein S3